MDASHPELRPRSVPTQRIRDAGLRVTRPRVAVLETLERLGGHRSADELHAALEHAGERLPRSSVFNVLRDLVDAGVVMAADAGPGRALYEANTEWHHHLVCRSCGRVFDVPCVTQTKPCLDALVPGAEIDEAQIIFRGRCAACVAA